MFGNLSKDDRQRYLVIGMILLFVFSTVAIYLFNPIGGGGNAGPVSPGANNTTLQFTGRGIANATLIYWEPVVVVSGTSEKLEAFLQPLKSSGIVTKDLPLAGGRILGLSDSIYVTNLTRDLLRFNLTVRGQGAISIAQAHVDSGTGIARTVAGGVYNFEDTPIFEAGDVFEVAFDAQVTGNTITAGPVNLQALASGLLGIEVTPESVRLNKTFWQTRVPWQNRTLNIGQFQINLVGFDTARYQMRSYVQFAAPLTDKQKSALLSAPPAWLDVNNIQSDLVGVQLTYTNRSQVSADLAALGATPIFPDSPLGVFPGSSNRSNEQISADISRVWDETFPSMPTNFTQGYVLDVVLPPTIVLNSQTYQVANRTMQIASDYAPMENGTLKGSFSPIGRSFNGFSGAPIYSPPSQKIGDIQVTQSR